MGALLLVSVDLLSLFSVESLALGCFLRGRGNGNTWLFSAGL